MGVAKSMTLRGGPTLSVTMTLIFPKIVWTCPLSRSVPPFIVTVTILVDVQYCSLIHFALVVFLLNACSFLLNVKNCFTEH